jgi:hypothetical protein
MSATEMQAGSARTLRDLRRLAVARGVSGWSWRAAQILYQIHGAENAAAYLKRCATPTPEEP